MNKVTPEVGKTYTLDKSFRGGYDVEVVAVFGQHFCRVKSEDSEWDVMISRLSEKESE